ncbi:MAG: hypothetical protein DRI65_06650 [Chloroflexota bacterium]|nr:MAG: hypothetical protein DRI65_06650 [Chloroflexota bacterium]
MIVFDSETKRLRYPEVYCQGAVNAAEESMMSMINYMADKLDFVYKIIYMNEATKGYPIKD